MSGNASSAPPPARLRWGPALLIFLSVFVAFGGALRNDFVRFDDDLYVTGNPHVRAGLTREGVRWAFTSMHDANWFPLTLASHMLDVSLFGLNPAGHHFTSLLLHALNGALLYGLLRRLTGRAWPAAFAAAVWALHPLRVESVAWVSERKDVLCALFGLLTLLAYERYARRPTAGRYLATGLYFALGLMAKPMLVTLPFVMLLLDYWPLGRGPAEGWRHLALEKLPLLAIAATACVVTFLVQRAGGALKTIDQFALAVRAGNAVAAYAEYIRLLLWPANLAVFYPHPGVVPPWSRLLPAMAVLLGFTALALRLGRRQPHLPVGWFWYLGMLIPVIGLVQVGIQSHADRYTYLPHIGLLILLAWSADRWLGERTTARMAAFAVLLPLAWAAHRQTATWRDSESLFLRAIAVTGPNAVARNNLGAHYATQGRRAEAEEHLRRSLEIQPGYADAQFNLANLLLEAGRRPEAIAEYRATLEYRPHHLPSLNNLAWLLATDPDSNAEDRAESLVLAERAIGPTRSPDAGLLDTLAAALAANGRFEEAARAAAQALDLARAAGQEDLARRLERRLAAYREGRIRRE